MARVKWNSQGVIRIINRNATDEALQIMKEVQAEAIANAPLDTGELRASSEIVHNRKSITVFFRAKHALVQHENLHFKHKYGKAKYLEDAYNSIVPGARVRIQKRINDALK